MKAISFSFCLWHINTSFMTFKKDKQNRWLYISFSFCHYQFHCIPPCSSTIIAEQISSQIRYPYLRSTILSDQSQGSIWMISCQQGQWVIFFLKINEVSHPHISTRNHLFFSPLSIAIPLQLYFDFQLHFICFPNATLLYGGRVPVKRGLFNLVRTGQSNLPRP